MDKDVDRIPKNPDTDIVIRVDDFGGRKGLTIREFVRGERYTGFTKSGTKIPAEHFKAFKKAINSIDEDELMEGVGEGSQVGLNGAKSSGKENDDSDSSAKENDDNDLGEEAI